MAKETTDSLWLGTDLTRVYHIKDEAETTAINISGFALSYMEKRYQSDVDADAILTKTTTAGAFDADPAEFTAVTGDGVDMAVVYVDTGDAATSDLLCKLDSGVTGLPYTPSGADVLLNWGAYIFALTDPA